MLRCLDCIYYKLRLEAKGQCRFNPPPWFEVDSDEWCGQGEEIEVYKAKKHQMQVRTASFLGVVFPETTLPTEEEKV